MRSGARARGRGGHNTHASLLRGEGLSRGNSRVSANLAQCQPVSLSMEGANEYALREEEERRHAAQQQQWQRQPQQQQRAARAQDRTRDYQGAWANETRRVAQETEQVADLLGQLAEVVDGYDAQLDSILDTTDETVGTLLDGTEEIAASGKRDAAHTHKRNVPLAVGAVSGVVGAVALTPMLGVVTGAAGAAVGYGVGTKISGGIANAIDSELQAARDIAEDDGVDRGPLISTDTLEWRWGDVGIDKLAQSNPLRWASAPPGMIVRDLRGRSEKDQLRPVILRWKRAGRDSSATFKSVRDAVRWIEDALAGRSVAPSPAPAPARVRDARGGGSRSPGLAGEFGRDEHLHRALRHAARAGDTIAEVAPRLATQGEKIDRVNTRASAAEGVISAAARANKSRTVLGAMGAAWGSGARESSGSVSAATARQKPVWIRSHQAPVCMLCDAEFASSGGKHHCRYCGWAVCGKCSLHSIAGLKRWLHAEKPHAICHTPSAESKYSHVHHAYHQMRRLSANLKATLLI